MKVKGECSILPLITRVSEMEGGTSLNSIRRVLGLGIVLANNLIYCFKNNN